MVAHIVLNSVQTQQIVGESNAFSAFRRATLILFASVFTGCATQVDIAEQAAKANRAVEDAHNQVLVLNVVRAYKQRPMYFTAIAKFSGPLGVISPSATLSIPFGGQASNIYTLTPTFKADTPACDIAVLDTQEFMLGFMKPVAPSTIKYYLDQGWPAHFVLGLFIREIRVPNNKKPYVNYPDEKAEFDRFQQELKRLVFDCNLKLVSGPAKTVAIGPMLSESTAASNLSHLVAMQKEGLQLREIKTDGKQVYQLQKSGSDVLVALDKKCEQIMIFAMPDLVRQPTKEDYEMILRSPEAILYYLGELSRVQIDGRYDGDKKPYVPKTWITKDKEEPTFVLKKDAPRTDKEAVVAVVHEGETYFVPRAAPGEGKSMHVLSLISQLIGLQKKASELPTTTTVRVIGQ